MELNQMELNIDIFKVYSKLFGSTKSKRDHKEEDDDLYVKINPSIN